MSCTLKELQMAEYEILCVFDDFCKKYDIKYTLGYGTLLGAIRHNGFIPWDDDIDVIMEINQFNKLKKKIRKNPIEGFDFCWIDDKCEFYPFYFAKLRKNGTHMPEPSIRHLNIRNGVWIDIFVYSNKPKSKSGIKLQDTSFGILEMSGQKYINKAKTEGKCLSKLCIAIDKCPDGILRIIRKILFFLITLSGKKETGFVRVLGSIRAYNFRQNKSIYEPTAKHLFEDRTFDIPGNYDELLRLLYGDDYMTPIESHIHAHLDEIEL